MRGNAARPTHNVTSALGHYPARGRKRVSRTLREGHFTPEQAEALAEALGEAAHDDLATKADLAALKAELKADIAEVRADILYWVVGAIGFQTVVLPALVSLVRIFAK